MTARSVPEQPTFTNTSEQDVWRKLCRQLPDGCVVLPNFRLRDTTKDHEVDLLVLMPGSGIVAVEVKGGSVWVDDAGAWHMGDQDRYLDPVKQARDACYAARHYVEADYRWGSRTRVRWSHHVVLARTRLHDDFATPQCPRWQISGRGDLGNLGGRVWDMTDLHMHDARPLAIDEVALVEEILQGRFLPRRDPVGLAADREEVADRLTMEQTNLLGVTRMLHRVEVRGGAGSGKTVMAIKQARDLAAGRYTGQRQRVALVCYSYGLANHLSRELLVGSRSKRPAFVGTFEDLAVSWGIEITGTREDTDYWENQLPAQMAEVAFALPPEGKFDAVIVDEAQDFADDWWMPLLHALKDEEAGGLYAYADDHQRVFARFGHPPVTLVPLVLDHNLRNTRQIAASFAPLAPTSMELRGGEGPEVTFVPCSVADAVSVADDQVEALLDEGWQPADIALITAGKRHPVQQERQASLGQHRYWEEFWSGDDIFYGHVLGFKGMERRAVILCVNEDGSRDRSKERLYVGLSRATNRLVVVGEPAAISRIGGPQVAERLGISVEPS